ncbi:polysaccharide deacetylase family protein [Sphingobacterium sp. 1.A.4]|uniref:polysaccharide deacetylase family protein n=1 Tax=Sphingobacterium sp. 1.A.4 TaxID=2044603 RepID=UPI00211EFF97|nr:polysaccharide deacetylase family protein [Sphingobacterium sp. 1.A.4]
MGTIRKALNKNNIKGSFFVTGRFLEDRKSANLLKNMYKEGHEVGPHSDQHLLYAPWEKRDSLLVTKEVFNKDLTENISKLHALGIQNIDKFVAPFEWYNKTITEWAKDVNLVLYNFTPGLRTAADYTFPAMGNKYMSSEAILEQLYKHESQFGLNGFIIIIHIGSDPNRMDKFFNQLEKLIKGLKDKNYKFVPLNEI